jgi:hypothetical protein
MRRHTVATSRDTSPIGSKNNPFESYEDDEEDEPEESLASFTPPPAAPLALARNGTNPFINNLKNPFNPFSDTPPRYYLDSVYS